MYPDVPTPVSAKIIVVYINVGNISPQKSEEYTCKIKETLKGLTDRFSESIFVPVRYGNTHIQVIDPN